MNVYQLWHGFSPPINWHLSPISMINCYWSIIKIGTFSISTVNWYWSIINWHLSPISIINWYWSSRAAAAYYWRNNQAGSGSLSSKKDKTYYWRCYLSCVNHQYLLDKKDKINSSWKGLLSEGSRNEIYFIIFRIISWKRTTTVMKLK